MPLRSTFLFCSWRPVCALCCLVVFFASAGCRKSATDIAEEDREERDEMLEAQWRFEQAEARARNLFYQGKEMRKQGRYAEAVKVWAKAISVDKNVALSVKLAKNLMAAEMIEKAHFQMHRPFLNRGYWKSSRGMLETIVDEKNNFFKKHITKAYKELDEWEWIKGGWKKFDEANSLITTHRLAEGLDMLESICKNYPRTPLQDKSIKLLNQYGRK